MAQDKNSAILFKKYQAGTCNQEEQKIVEHWLTFGDFREFDLSEKELSDDLKAIQDQLKTITEKKQRSLWPRIAAAASVLLCLSAALYFYTDLGTSAENSITIQQEIAGGSNKAILTLADGSKISITDATNGELVKEPGVVISKTADGQLIYKVTEGRRSSKTKKTAYNTIETPRGGQHQVLLPDGTRVWLNAASSIRFPEIFSNVDVRNVELKGEAYFEVAKDKKHPFIVKTERQQVEVLGTHFNVNSYSDEQKSVTTLLEGLVKVAPIGYQNGTPGMVLSNLSSIIKPGQQASSSGAELKVSAADTDQVLDWKNGDFMFKKETLSGIMRKVSRWYDVTVQYDGNVDLNQTFSGLVSRSKNISEVLKIMQSAGQLKFNVTGKKIVITQ
jgi:transmembrane sensor